MPVIVDNALYRDGSRVKTGGGPPTDDPLRLRGGPGDFQWLGVFNPSPSELAAVTRAFDLHPLAAADAQELHHRPKVEQFGDHLYLVLKTLWYVDEEDAVETGEIHVFLGPDFVITIRHGDGSQLKASRRDLELRAQVLTHGPIAVLYAVCDHVVDEYERVAAELEVDVDEVEASVFAQQRTNDSARIYTLKREIAEVRRAVLPLREPMRIFASGEHPSMNEESGAYFREVASHLQRVAESVDALDSLLSTAFDAHLASISVQQNDDMRKISAGAALIVVPTFIAGVYGMNFVHMPELNWRYGYPFALALMVAVMLVLWLFFKRSKWL